jgi:putative oxidoreductase
MKLSSAFSACSHAFAVVGDALQSFLLLAIRLYWGWSFFSTGKGKLLHLDRITTYFASLHLPAPKLNAILAGSTECFGGLLLLVGLASRMVCVPLIFTMLVAYATAEREALTSLFSEPDKFTGAAPFLFLFAAVIVFVFGPGRFSLDALIAGRARRPIRKVASAETVGSAVGR